MLLIVLFIFGYISNSLFLTLFTHDEMTRSHKQTGKIDYTQFNSNTVVPEKSTNVFSSTKKNTKTSVSSEIADQREGCDFLQCPKNAFCVDKFHSKCKCKEGFIDKGKLDCVEGAQTTEDSTSSYSFSTSTIAYTQSNSTTGSFGISIKNFPSTVKDSVKPVVTEISSQREGCDFLQCPKNAFCVDKFHSKCKCKEGFIDVGGLNCVEESTTSEKVISETKMPATENFTFSVPSTSTRDNMLNSKPDDIISENCGHSLYRKLFKTQAINTNATPNNKSTNSVKTVSEMKIQVTENSKFSASSTLIGTNSVLNSTPITIVYTNHSYSFTKQFEIPVTNVPQVKGSLVSKNAIACGVGGALLTFILIAAVLFLLKRRKLRRQSQQRTYQFDDNCSSISSNSSQA